jgi:hypothetical protein
VSHVSILISIAADDSRELLGDLVNVLLATGAMGNGENLQYLNT